MVTVEAVSARAVGALVDSLHLSGQRLSGHELMRLVVQISNAPHLWRPLVRHIPSERWYQRLYSTGGFEVWLLGWEVAQDTQIHDHGGSSGAFCVTEGALVEYHAELSHPGPMLRHSHASGHARTFGPSYVHNLVNEGPALATSVHAYSPPLTKMTYYRRMPEEGFALERTLEVDGPERNTPMGDGR